MTPYTCPYCGLPCVETVCHEGAADCVLALKAEVRRLRDEAARVRFGQATEVRTPLPEDSAER